MGGGPSQARRTQESGTTSRPRLQTSNGLLDLCDFLREGQAISFCGSSGTGKTAAAIETARNFLGLSKSSAALDAGQIEGKVAEQATAAAAHSKSPKHVVVLCAAGSARRYEHLGEAAAAAVEQATATVPTPTAVTIFEVKPNDPFAREQSWLEFLAALHAVKAFSAADIPADTLFVIDDVSMIQQTAAGDGFFTVPQLLNSAMGMAQGSRAGTGPARGAVTVLALVDEEEAAKSAAVGSTDLVSTVQASCDVSLNWKFTHAGSSAGGFGTVSGGPVGFGRTRAAAAAGAGGEVDFSDLLRYTRLRLQRSDLTANNGKVVGNLEAGSTTVELLRDDGSAQADDTATEAQDDQNAGFSHSSMQQVITSEAFAQMGSAFQETERLEILKAVGIHVDEWEVENETAAIKAPILSQVLQGQNTESSLNLSQLLLLTRACTLYNFTRPLNNYEVAVFRREFLGLVREAYPKLWDELSGGGQGRLEQMLSLEDLDMLLLRLRGAPKFTELGVTGGGGL